MIFVLGLPLLLIGMFLVFLTWALQPGLSADQFPPEAILHYPVSTKLPPKEAPATLTILSYNMGYASGEKNNRGAMLNIKEVQENLDRMVMSLKHLQPDMVFLQEVDFFAQRSFDINQMKFLAEGLGLPYVAYAVNWNKRYVPWPFWPLPEHFGRLVSGQAVLSRYPILKQKTLLFPKPEDNYFWYNWFYIDRLLQEITVQVGKNEITAFNIHLEAFSTPARSYQLKTLTQRVLENSDKYKIVAGDFNLTWFGTGKNPQEVKRHRALLEEFLTGSRLKMAGEHSDYLTYPSWDPKRRIDFIFYSRDLKLLNEDVVKKLPSSDHLPVWARFQI